MAEIKKKPAPERVQIVWPKTGATARPFAKDLQKWLDKGWKRVEPKHKAPKFGADTKETDQ